MRALLEPLLAAGHSLPEMPLELGGPGGGIGAVLLAGWPDARVGLAGAEDAADAARLRGEGWRVFDAEAGPGVDELAKALEEGQEKH